jgi:hypothetical protein
MILAAMALAGCATVHQTSAPAGTAAAWRTAGTSASQPPAIFAAVPSMTISAMANRLLGAWLGIFFGEAGEEIGDRATGFPADLSAVKGHHTVVRSLQDATDVVRLERLLDAKLWPVVPLFDADGATGLSLPRQLTPLALPPKAPFPR